MIHKHSYINNSIADPEKLPAYVIDILNKLKEADKVGDSIYYFDRIDDLCVIVKNAIAINAMSYDSWKIVKEKYWDYAEQIYEKEFEK